MLISGREKWTSRQKAPQLPEVLQLGLSSCGSHGEGDHVARFLETCRRTASQQDNVHALRRNTRAVLYDGRQRVLCWEDFKVWILNSCFVGEFMR